MKIQIFVLTLVFGLFFLPGVVAQTQSSGVDTECLHAQIGKVVGVIDDGEASFCVTVARAVEPGAKTFISATYSGPTLTQPISSTPSGKLLYLECGTASASPTYSVQSLAGHYSWSGLWRITMPASGDCSGIVQFDLQSLATPTTFDNIWRPVYAFHITSIDPVHKIEVVNELGINIVTWPQLEAALSGDIGAGITGTLATDVSGNLAVSGVEIDASVGNQTNNFPNATFDNGGEAIEHSINFWVPVIVFGALFIWSLWQGFRLPALAATLGVLGVQYAPGQWTKAAIFMFTLFLWLIYYVKDDPNNFYMRVVRKVKGK